MHEKPRPASTSRRRARRAHSASCLCSTTPTPARVQQDPPIPSAAPQTGTFALSTLGIMHFAAIGKEHWAIGTFWRMVSRRLRDTGQVSRGGPERPAALFRRTGRRS